MLLDIFLRPSHAMRGATAGRFALFVSLARPPSRRRCKIGPRFSCPDVLQYERIYASHGLSSIGPYTSCAKLDGVLSLQPKRATGSICGMLSSARDGKTCLACLAEALWAALPAVKILETLAVPSHLLQSDECNIFGTIVRRVLAAFWSIIPRCLRPAVVDMRQHVLTCSISWQ